MVDSKNGRTKTGRPKSFPKENERKLKDQIQKLKAKLKQVEKENKVMKAELQNIMKPVRKRRRHKEQPKQTFEVWREQFLAEVKESFKNRQEEEGCTIKLKQDR